MTKTTKVIAAENRNKAIELRKEGLTLRQIGRELGVSGTTVHKYISKALLELARDLQKETEHFRALQVARLETMLSEVYVKALDGDLCATDRALKIIQQLSKLMGCEAPTKVASTSVDGNDQPLGGIIVVPAVSGSVEEWLEEYG